MLHTQSRVTAQLLAVTYCRLESESQERKCFQIGQVKVILNKSYFEKGKVLQVFLINYLRIV